MKLLTYCRTGLICGLFCIVWGCSQRDRLNPLDPKNPNTEGKPVGVTILSDQDDVTVSWFNQSIEDILGFNIYRRQEGEDFEVIGVAAVSASSFTDPDLEYDRRFTYRISVLAEDYESPVSDSVSIVPGPHNYWISDLYGGIVAKLTYDAQHFINYSVNVLRPVSILADTISGGVWVLDAYGLLYLLSAEAEIIRWWEDLVDPTLIAGNPSTNDIWVSHFSGTQISAYSTSGNLTGTFTGFQEISDMEWTGVLNGCWVADKEGQTIEMYSRAGNLEISTDSTLSTPTSISCFQKEGWIWIADSLELKQVRFDGRVETILELETKIRKVSVDQSSGDCWIIRELGDGYKCEVMKISQQGLILTTVEGFYDALSILANSFNGGCLVADTGNGRVIRISSEGEIQSTLGGFLSPWDIVVD